MTEFTGERVVPGAVNEDLWAEHIARYAFAARYVSGGRVLDLGCGTGYGTAELAPGSRDTIGIDISYDAVQYARLNYPLQNLHFLRGTVTALPIADASVDLITAFEVIEHLEDWPLLISEARRVLHPDGLFLVSTPNRLYYTDSRGTEGPNPFHVHEFTFAEFRDALSASFPSVAIFQQNRTGSFAFAPVEPILTTVDARMDVASHAPDHAHFFVGLCGINIRPDPRSFVYLPRASNLLREREQHIALLQSELQLTKDSLAKSLEDHQTLMHLHAAQQEQLEEHNRWALQLEKDWRSGLERISQLQDELKAEQAAAGHVATAYAAKVVELEEENRVRTQWALDTETRLSGEIAAKSAELVEAVRLLDRAEETVAERTVWAQGLQQRLEQLEAQMRMIRESRWIKLGRTVGVGPQVRD
ncbi:MAG TPA: methyltransferase domain-containing protein [Bryobacteraceae bacterium]|nr:methyltransferase domain-containing protein [Bryobacteraceae bacterium]